MGEEKDTGGTRPFIVAFHPHTPRNHQPGAGPSSRVRATALFHFRRQRVPVQAFPPRHPIHPAQNSSTDWSDFFSLAIENSGGCVDPTAHATWILYAAFCHGGKKLVSRSVSQPTSGSRHVAAFLQSFPAHRRHRHVDETPSLRNR